jgi:hypothetical protein
MKPTHLITTLTIAVSVSGCQISEKAPGVWYGASYDLTSGNYSQVAMFVTQTGETRISTEDGLYMAGTAFFDEDIMYSLPVSNYGSNKSTNINHEAILQVSGEFADASVTLEVVNDDMTIQQYDFSKSTEPAADQKAYEGTWYANPHNPDPNYTWTIDSLGKINGNDESGCYYHGIVTASPDINVADLILTISKCVYAGDYHGIMSLLKDTESERVGIFYNFNNSNHMIVNGLEKIL